MVAAGRSRGLFLGSSRGLFLGSGGTSPGLSSGFFCGTGPGRSSGFFCGSGEPGVFPGRG